MPLEDERLLGPVRRFDEEEAEATLRPRRLADYVVIPASRKSSASLSKRPVPGATP